MPNYTQSAYMNLQIPIVGVATGPDYATNIDTSLNTIDAHDHTTGNGKQLTQASLNITGDLNLQGNNLTFIKQLIFTPLTVLPLASNIGLYVNSANNLYYNDGTNQIPITSGGAVNATTSVLANPPSYAVFDGTTLKIWANQSSLTPGPVQLSTVLFTYNNSGTLYSFTLQAPTPLTSSYTITLPSQPSAPPSVNYNGPAGSPVFLQVAGNLITAPPQDHFLPPGIIMPYAGADTTIPAGWLFCNGAAVSRTTYAKLFAIIGSTYGSGDGINTFNLPDLRGIFPRGAGTNGNGAITSGGTGSTIGTYQIDGFKSHNHGGGNHTHTYVATQYAGGMGIQSNSGQQAINGTFTTSSSGIIIATEGTTETRPANLSLNYIIKI